MVLHSGDPHSWINSLAHATFDDNVDRVGRVTALQLLREDIRSWIRERKGQSSQWSLRVQDGKMVTETGVSLQEMTDNITNGPHSDLVPESIKATAPLEAATLEEATRLAVIGANRIVLPEQHLDETGNVVSRYLSVWTKNASDPTRYDGTRIDLGKNTRIEDVRTGTSFAAFGLNEDIAFHQHHEQKHAFVLEVKEGGGKPFDVVEKAIITTIHRSHQETYAHDLQGHASLKDERLVRLEQQQARHEVFDKTKNLDADLFIYIPHAVVRETTETVRGIAVFLRDKEKRKEGIDRIRRVFVRGKNSVNNHNTVAPSLSTGQKEERLTLGKIREKPVRAGKEIEKQHTEMGQKVMALFVAAETKVALGAVPLLVALLAKEQPKPIEAVKKSIRRRRKKELRIMKAESRKKVKAEAKKGAIRENNKRNTRRKVYMREAAVRRPERKIGVRKIAVAEKITPTPMERRERERKRRVGRVMRMAERVLETKPVPKKEKKLWVALVVAGAEFARVPRREKRERAVAGIWFAWVLWMMLTRKGTETPKNNFKRSHPASQGETLRRQEETPWVLRAIIYYLTAIREQAMRNHPVAQMNPVQQTIPHYAVIYAFAS